MADRCTVELIFVNLKFSYYYQRNQKTIINDLVLTFFFVYLAIDLISTDDGFVGLADVTYTWTDLFPGVIRVRSPTSGDSDPTYYFYGFVGWDFPANRTEWQVSSAM